MLVGVIGSRSLPASFASLVSRVVAFYLASGFRVASGGAVGADSFALSALLQQGSASRGIIFSAWDSVSGFPAPVRPEVEQLLAGGGQVVWGSASAGSSRQVAVSALLARNRRLVSASSVIVAFLHGPSRGSLYTVRQALGRGVPVVIVLCGSGTVLPPDVSGRCVLLHLEFSKEEVF